MLEPNFTILYVDSPAKSAAFYEALLGVAPVEFAPTFAMFALSSGTMLCMWSKHTVEPAATATGGGTEIAFSLNDKESVNKTYALWKNQGLPILQEPTEMDFGYTFVALDPDGHRLRVFVPTME